MIDIITYIIESFIDLRQNKSQRRKESINFIRNYHDSIGLLPLCAIAYLYDESFNFSNRMYVDFCKMNDGAKKLTLKKALKYPIEIQLSNRHKKDFYKKCLEKIEDIQNTVYEPYLNYFYDGGKYLVRSITYFKDTPLPEDIYIIKRNIKKIILDEVDLESFDHDFKFSQCPEERACVITCIVAQAIAEKYSLYNVDDEKYGNPCCYDGETIETLEDLFLETLYVIYTRLVLNKCMDLDKEYLNKRR